MNQSTQSTVPTAETSTGPKRIVSIDQLRGYAIFGMIFVNYLGHFPVMPETFRHHHYGFSYADTIAPLFMFVVGIGFRLSGPRRVQKVGKRAAFWAAAKRYITLILDGVVGYGGGRRGGLEAVVDNGFSGLVKGA